MLTIHFEQEDLRKLRLADGWHPLWETVLSLRVLQQPTRAVEPRHREWLRFVTDWLHRSPSEQRPVRLLAGVCPPASYFPDYLTPLTHGRHLDQQLEVVAATSRSRIRLETQRAHTTGSLATQLLNGDSNASRELVGLLSQYHQRAIVPFQQTIDHVTLADNQQRTELLARQGIDAVLSSFAPSVMTWEPPDLKVAYRVDRRLALGGRGLTLIPSWFGTTRAITVADPSLPPVLVYPAQAATQTTPVPDRARVAGLASLVGRTRALVLTEVTGVSTTALARQLGFAPSSVSEHLSVLRDVGLICSVRQGTTMLHARTRLGDDVVAGARA